MYICNVICIYAKYGKINLKNAKYKEDFTPISNECDLA